MYLTYIFVDCYHYMWALDYAGTCVSGCHTHQNFLAEIGQSMPSFTAEILTEAHIKRAGLKQTCAWPIYNPSSGPPSPLFFSSFLFFFPLLEKQEKLLYLLQFSFSLICSRKFQRRKKGKERGRNHEQHRNRLRSFGHHILARWPRLPDRICS